METAVETATEGGAVGSEMARAGGGREGEVGTAEVVDSSRKEVEEEEEEGGQRVSSTRGVTSYPVGCEVKVEVPGVETWHGESYRAWCKVIRHVNRGTIKLSHAELDMEFNYRLEKHGSIWTRWKYYHRGQWKYHRPSGEARGEEAKAEEQRAASEKEAEVVDAEAAPKKRSAEEEAAEKKRQRKRQQRTSLPKELHNLATVTSGVTRATREREVQLEERRLERKVSGPMEGWRVLMWEAESAAGMEKLEERWMGGGLQAWTAMKERQEEEEEPKKKLRGHKQEARLVGWRREQALQQSADASRPDRREVAFKNKVATVPTWESLVARPSTQVSAADLTTSRTMDGELWEDMRECVFEWEDGAAGRILPGVAGRTELQSWEWKERSSAFSFQGQSALHSLPRPTAEEEEAFTELARQRAISDCGTRGGQEAVSAIKWREDVEEEEAARVGRKEAQLIRLPDGEEEKERRAAFMAAQAEISPDTSGSDVMQQLALAEAAQARYTILRAMAGRTHVVPVRPRPHVPGLGAMIWWSAQEARDEWANVKRFTGLPEWFRAVNKLPIFVTMWWMESASSGTRWVRGENGVVRWMEITGTLGGSRFPEKWRPGIVTATSAGMMLKKKAAELGVYMACQDRQKGEYFHVGWLDGPLVTEGSKESAQFQRELARAQRDNSYLFESREAYTTTTAGKAAEKTHVRVRDARFGQTGGAKHVNDAHNIPGALNKGCLDPSGEVFLQARTEVTPLTLNKEWIELDDFDEARAELHTDWAALMQSEIFYDYGEDYWKREASQDASSTREGKRKLK